KRTHVLAGMRLYRRLAIAMKIVHATEPRRDVLPVREIVDGTVLTRRDESARWRDFLRNVCVEELDPHARVDRQTIECPGVLNVEAEVVSDVLFRFHRRVVRDYRYGRADAVDGAVLLNQIDAVLHVSLVSIPAL